MRVQSLSVRANWRNSFDSPIEKEQRSNLVVVHFLKYLVLKKVGNFLNNYVAVYCAVVLPGIHFRSFTCLPYELFHGKTIFG